MNVKTLFLLFISSCCTAENWQQFTIASTDNQTITHMYVDINSISIKPDNIGANFRVKFPNVNVFEFYGWLPTSDCYEDVGIFAALVDGYKLETAIWTNDGKRVYDVSAKWLCKYFENKLI